MNDEIKEKFTVKCGDCDKNVLDVVVLKDEPGKLTKLKVYCPCGGSSYLIPIQGKHKIWPPEPLTLKNVINLENREEVYVG